MSLGALSGLGLPFIDKLDGKLLIALILLYGTSAVGIYFIRETKEE
jgi:hypothetical protein